MYVITQNTTFCNQLSSLLDLVCELPLPVSSLHLPVGWRSFRSLTECLLDDCILSFSTEQPTRPKILQSVLDIKLLPKLLSKKNLHVFKSRFSTESGNKADCLKVLWEGLLVTI